MSNDARVAKYAQDFGNWKVDKFLGQGGFGLVVRLKRERFGVVEYCAMKIVHLCRAKKVNGRIPPAYYEVKRQLRQDDLREVLLMDTLKGTTNIVDFQDWDVKDWAEDDKVECDLVIRMELLESLDKILADNRKLSEKEIIKIGTDICRALEICHKERIIHRDIKPANIFRNRRGDYKLGDFVGAPVAVSASKLVNQESDKDHLKSLKKNYKKRFFSHCVKSTSCEDVCPMGIPTQRAISKMNRKSVWRIWQLLNRD